MSFVYPKHFKTLGDVKPYQETFTDYWDQIIYQIPTPSGQRCAIEIGAECGGSAVYMLERFLTTKGDILHTMDIHLHPLFESNVEPYKDKVIFYLDLSVNVLSHLWLTHRRPIADLIYVDGSHKTKDVIQDAVLSWNLLKLGGVMIFDDNGWGEEVYNMPSVAIEAFLQAYQTHYFLLGKGWQVYLQKTKEDTELISWERKIRE
jgi:predicted O-methyltransferase YrrM